MTIFGSNIYGGTGNRSLNLVYNNPNNTIVSPQMIQIPIMLPTNATSDFTAAANFDGKLGYFDDFTIGSTYQMNIENLTVLYCAGTFTCGGNGIVTTQSTTSILRPVLEWNYESGVGGTNPNGNASGKGAGGGGNNAAGGTRYNAGSGARGGQGAGAKGVGSGAVSPSAKGSLIVICNAAVITSAITMSGGAGSNTVSNDVDSASGGGLGGSVIILAKTSITHSGGTVITSGGAAGVTAGANTGSSAGGDAGLIWYWAPTISTSGGTRTCAGGAGDTAGTGDGVAGGVPLMGSSGVLDITGNPFS